MDIFHDADGRDRPESLVGVDAHLEVMPMIWGRGGRLNVMSKLSASIVIENEGGVD